MKHTCGGISLAAIEGSINSLSFVPKKGRRVYASIETTSIRGRLIRRKRWKKIMRERGHGSRCHACTCILIVSRIAQWSWPRTWTLDVGLVFLTNKMLISDSFFLERVAREETFPRTRDTETLSVDSIFLSDYVKKTRGLAAINRDPGVTNDAFLFLSAVASFRGTRQNANVQHRAQFHSRSSRKFIRTIFQRVRPRD